MCSNECFKINSCSFILVAVQESSFLQRKYYIVHNYKIYLLQIGYINKFSYIHFLDTRATPEAMI